MCAPRTCLPPKKNRLALTRSLCALRAHVCPKKIGPQQFKKKGSRFALAMCATRTCLPPHNQSLPPSCPPQFLNPGAATASIFCWYFWYFISETYIFRSQITSSYIYNQCSSCYYLWYGVIIYKRQYTDKTLTLRESMYICERASLQNFRTF